MRRVWIEIRTILSRIVKQASPSMRRVWIEMRTGLSVAVIKTGHPPCGGCGLKSIVADVAVGQSWSPSMRRVWIEICPESWQQRRKQVTLHAEGVD